MHTYHKGQLFQVIEHLDPLCTAANLSDIHQLVNDLRDYVDLPQIQLEVSEKNHPYGYNWKTDF